MKRTFLLVLIALGLFSTVLQAQVGPGRQHANPSKDKRLKPAPTMPKQPLRLLSRPSGQVAKAGISGGSIGKLSYGYTPYGTIVTQASGGTIAEYITPEISALARNLENNPLRIYNYVHGYIKYSHYFGSNKG